MLRFHLSALSVGLASLLVSFAVQADTMVVERKIITTPAPKATCTTVEGRWKDNTWISSHEVCKYENRKEGAAWVNSYWSCTDVAADETCNNWTLVPGYWTQTLD